MFGKKKVEIGYMIKVFQTDRVYVSDIKTKEGTTEWLPTVFRSLKEAQKKLIALEKATGEKFSIIEILIK